MTDILTNALNEQDYLLHYGILGQKWGVRRYQNPYGSLTSEGRVHYGYKDKKRERTIRRGVAASTNEIKKAAKRAQPYKERYDKKADAYEKEKNRIRIFSRGTRETDINNAFYRMNKAKDALNPYQREVDIAVQTAKEWDNKYKSFRQDMIKKYGYVNVGEIKRGKLKASKNYVYDNVIKPGLTIADLPIVGSEIGRRYTEDSLKYKRLKRA